MPVFFWVYLTGMSGSIAKHQIALEIQLIVSFLFFPLLFRTALLDCHRVTIPIPTSLSRSSLQDLLPGEPTA